MCMMKAVCHADTGVVEMTVNCHHNALRFFGLQPGQARSENSIGLSVLAKSSERVFDLARNTPDRSCGLCGGEERLNVTGPIRPAGVHVLQRETHWHRASLTAVRLSDSRRDTRPSPKDQCATPPPGHAPQSCRSPAHNHNRPH